LLSISQQPHKLVGGIPTPLKNDGVKVSWDDYSIPNMMGKIKNVPNHHHITYFSSRALQSTCNMPVSSENKKKLMETMIVPNV